MEVLTMVPTRLRHRLRRWLGTLIPLTLSWLVGLLLAACGDAPCTPDVCDIRTAACQDTTMDATACLSGLDAVPVTVRVVSEADYAKQVRAARSTQSQADFEAKYEALALLALGPEGDTPDAGLSAQIDTTAAAYWQDGQKIYIIDRGAPLDSISAVTLLVHEFSHALQFQTDKRLPEPDLRTLDAKLSWVASVEGEASWISDRAFLLMIGRDPDDVDWHRMYDRWAADELGQFELESRKVGLIRGYFAYAFGARWLLDQPSEGQLPVAGSSRQVMTGQVSTPHSEAAVPRVPGEVLAVDSLGQFVVTGWVNAALSAADPSHLRVRPDIAGDTLTVLRTARGHLGVIWHIEFDAGQGVLLDSLQNDLERTAIGSKGVEVLRDGRVLIVMASEDTDAVRSWKNEPLSFEPRAFEGTAF